MKEWNTNLDKDVCEREEQAEEMLAGPLLLIAESRELFWQGQGADSWLRFDCYFVAEAESVPPA